tara:strand:+ start:77 stop:286 length:210 start_codon:yes stop_codon:yes gene_type:complete
MTTLKRQIQLKLKKFDELMVELKIKYADDKSQKEFEDELDYKDSVFYSELHKLDEKIQEVSKLVDNNKD